MARRMRRMLAASALVAMAASQLDVTTAFPRQSWQERTGTAKAAAPVPIVTETTAPTTSAETVSVSAMAVASSIAVTGSSTSSGADACAEYNQISSSCGEICPNNGLCVAYRKDGKCVDTDESTCVEQNGCTYECLTAASSEIDEWYTTFYGTPQWDPSQKTAGEVEAIRLIKVPRNITRLSFRAISDEVEDVKGKAFEVEFPDHQVVSNQSTLTQLGLLNIDIAKIPDTVFTGQLRSLVLQNCLMQDIPKAVYDLPKLTMLIVDMNNLTSIPSEVGNLSLDQFSAIENDLTEFPADQISNMPRLRELALSFNQITHVDLEMDNAALEYLEMDGNQLLDFQGVFPRLNTLYISRNQMSSFPTSLRQLPALVELDLSWNLITSDEVNQAAEIWTHPKLNTLYLTSNQLTEFPDLSNIFPVLTHLLMRNNTVPKMEGTISGKLEYLNVRGSKMTKFDASFMRLQYLDLGDNELKEIPALSKISPELQTLNISGNSLTTFHDSSDTLTALNISKNALTSLDLTAPKLRVLDISANSFTKIPDCVWNMNVLEELYVANSTALEPIMFTAEQYAFLQRLSVFTIDGRVVAPSDSCPAEWQAEVHAIKVCVENGPGSVDALSGAGDSNKTSPWSWIAVFLVSAAVGAICVGVFIATRRRRQAQMEKDLTSTAGMMTSMNKTGDLTIGLTSTESNMLNSNMMRSNGLGIWDDEELLESRVDFDSITLEQRLASGAYGEIWIGQYRNQPVAIKKLNDAGKKDRTALTYFVSEVKLFAQLDHPRIVGFFGVAWTSLTDICAVIEYMPRGDLYSLLRTDALTRGNWDFAKLQIAMDTVEALTYVHTLDPKLVHRDLKSRNVLMDYDLRAKLTDFGISRYQSEDMATMTAGIGTGRWMAPEVIMGRSDYDEKVDIYSFGVILSELDTHEMPFSDNEPMSEIGILQSVASGELRPHFTRSCPPAIFDIAQKCLTYNPDERPSSLDVAYWLRQLAPMFQPPVRETEAPRTSTRSGNQYYMTEEAWSSARFQKQQSRSSTDTFQPGMTGSTVDLDRDEDDVRQQQQLVQQQQQPQQQVQQVQHQPQPYQAPPPRPQQLQHHDDDDDDDEPVVFI
ncbi:hypothetical protein Poli38472_010807 [Pythium oligandrum]|uniref:non-specific serine/threonine protein kinase n=1 Tax=Pythium oligandrum TaxID=41045 RepID=A0A8K1CEV3_PYTOL|nr:hypothetical protein Poli38472_010807 [Pythium oligandrum]|eukprot:TMW61744.1 hypothetical protein Poli38472_010807 [Pythium oligandrum]